jgi:FkbM family methyltransferase
MHYITKIFRDFWGLLGVCGAALACQWMLATLWCGKAILRQKNLQPADHAMGAGPFQVRLRKYNARFKIKGAGAFSGIREMYVRDTYLHAGMLAIRDGDCVVDLGANMGNFTNLALAHGDNVRVVAVEPGRDLNASLRASVGLNDGYSERVKLIRAFVGLAADTQRSMLTDAQYADAQWLSEDELIAMAGIDRVDFLKCDIEGGEFGLLTPQSKLLRMAQSLAIEIHHFAGSVDQFLDMLRECGFTVLAVQRDPDGTATALARRSVAA